MPLEIANSRSDRLAVDLSAMTPQAFADLSLDQAKRWTVPYGNGTATLGELFAVRKAASDQRLTLAGDFSAATGVGAGLARGEILVDGNVGRRAGHAMSGGRLEIRGDAGDGLGAEMKGGVIHVRGAAGSGVGGAIAGSPRGMTGGVILIDGDAQDDVGLRMRRGLIAIGGGASDALGHAMLGGTIVVCGACGPRAGAGMKRGTIVLLGTSPQLWPTLRAASRVPLSALGLVERELARHGFAHPQLAALTQPLDLLHGDMLAGARGEVLVAAQ